MKKDEMWTQRDGTKIAVGDMDESHVRNALRMVIRNDRKRRMRAALDAIIPWTVGMMQDHLDAQARDHTGMVFNAEGGFWYHANKA